MVSADGLARVWFSCEHGEQRVLVAAPRCALYVARNKYPLLAFRCEWVLLVCQLPGFLFVTSCFSNLASDSYTALVFAAASLSVFAGHLLLVLAPLI